MLNPAELEDESRKRPMGDDDGSSGVNKRAAADDTLVIKLLIPNHVAGTIIGKKGQSIMELQNETGARINLSQSREYFPGTSDRVVLIQGKPESVRNGVRAIISKIFDPTRQEGAAAGVVAPPPPMVKLTIPTGVAGMVIGRGGEIVRKLNEEIGSKIQISPKDSEFAFTGERIISIQGTAPQTETAALRILDMINESPEGCVYQNCTTAYGNSIARMQGGAGAAGGYRGGAPAAFGGAAAAKDQGAYRDYQDPAGAYRAAPANYSLFGSAEYQQQQQQQQGMAASQYAPPPPAAYVADPSYAGYNAGMREEVLTVSVPDDLVGAIVGRQGATIIELQRQSGATIKISPKGEYVPNTTDRIVMISGPPNATKAAHYLVSQKVQIAQTKRVGGVPPM